MTYQNGVLGEIWIFVGGRHRGKTTKMIQLAKPVDNDRLFYNEFHGNKWNTARRLRRYYQDDEDFIEFCMNVFDCMVVFEDASGVFKVSMSKRAMKMLARTRDSGVTIFLAFHSFKKIPDDLIDMIDGIYIFGTEDEERHVIHKTSRPEVVQAFREIKKSTNFYAHKKIRFIPKNK